MMTCIILSSMSNKRCSMRTRYLILCGFLTLNLIFHLCLLWHLLVVGGTALVPLIRIDQIRIGGAILHSSHVFRSFGNQLHRIVFCQHCGGSTTGGFSPILAAACHTGNAISMRRSRRMVSGDWPQRDMLANFGNGEVTQAVRFLQLDSEHFQIVPAATTSGSSGSLNPVAPGAA